MHPSLEPISGLKIVISNQRQKTIKMAETTNDAALEVNSRKIFGSLIKIITAVNITMINNVA